MHACVVVLQDKTSLVPNTPLACVHSREAGKEIREGKTYQMSSIMTQSWRAGLGVAVLHMVGAHNTYSGTSLIRTSIIKETSLLRTLIQVPY